jgi:hypothetical protein
MIYVKSFLTGLASLFAAVFLVGIVLIARVWMSSSGAFALGVDGSQIAGVLVASLLVIRRRLLLAIPAFVAQRVSSGTIAGLPECDLR